MNTELEQEFIKWAKERVSDTNNALTEKDVFILFKNKNDIAQQSGIEDINSMLDELCESGYIRIEQRPGYEEKLFFLTEKAFNKALTSESEE